MAEREIVVRLYKQLLRESSKFTNYNFRSYAIRRVQDAFREHKGCKDSEKLQQLIEEAKNNLSMLKRQVAISAMYETTKLVVEKNNTTSHPF
ncbi:LYR motif-containing protein 4-like protein [Leptotrombidium deliense]|uniref:LYR motif-containing protein 4-like protein n=1 Tax=Leptotrombidium deliense TaxID=299467 RepID=A0A443SFZ7_9ACAR|nr:LYR motif-containing protein 4-like protein [Leptotrombidium deliense]